MSTPPTITLYPATPGARRGTRPAARRLAVETVRALASVLVILVTTVVGIGWLYTLRKAGALDAGPRLPEALPLQRLAGGATQPALRLVAAWLPTGVVAGLALRATGFGRLARVAWALPGALVLLMAAGAASDAITASEPLRTHLAAQPGRAAIWLAAGLFAAGAALPRSRAR